MFININVGRWIDQATADGILESFLIASEDPGFATANRSFYLRLRIIVREATVAGFMC
ncbi:MAG TPA: hypothetical protein VIE66_15760 [Methylocella sp.]|jgi:hypothetical protein